MKWLWGLSGLTSAERHAVVTMGNFDGVHKGHQQLLQRVVRVARASQSPSLVITFEPHPQQFFKRPKRLKKIYSLREKCMHLSKTGVDATLALHFNQVLSQLSAERFINDILIQGLGVKHIILGDDFRFGYQRQGDLALLQAFAKTKIFTVEAIPTVAQDQQRLSSSRIRQLLSEGHCEAAAALLGNPYKMSGKVMSGDQRGRLLGFPTVNIHWDAFRLLPYGIYIVNVYGVGEKPWPGVANVGIRPTFPSQNALLEVHLLDYNGDLYGKRLEVEFLQWVRGEKFFTNLEALTQAIAEDVKIARQYHETIPAKNA